jgi:hypothetical protein
MGERCLTKSTLTALLPHREWTGKPSTTQLLKPTLIAFLEITKPYYIDPADMVFAFIGTKVHKKLQLAQTDISKLETAFEDDDMTGVADNYEVEDGLAILTDHKIIGSFAIKKLVDGDTHDYTLQLNRYRLFFEAIGLPVDKMRLEVFPRDGYTQMAKWMKTPKKVFHIPINKLPDDEVLGYFQQKKTALMQALANPDAYPPQCSLEENWKRRRCSGYCSVQKVCPYVGTKRIKTNGGAIC